MKASLAGYLLAVGAILFWSFNVLIAKSLAAELSPFQIAFGRWFVATLIILPMTAKSLIASKQIIKANIKQIVVMSLMAVVLQNTLVYEAGRTASVINMALLGTVGPIFLVVFSSVFMHTKITVKQMAGFACALFGVLVLITKGHIFNLEKFTFVTGDFWMLGMTVTFGIYGVLQTKKIEGISSLTLLGAMVFIGILILFPVFLGSLVLYPVSHLSPKALSLLIYMGVFPSVFSYLCWDIALEKLGALKTGLLYYLMPVFSSIEAYFILGEKMSAAQLSGGVFVLIGVFIAAYHKPKHQVPISRI